MVLARLFFKDITSICKLNKYKALFSLIPVTYFDYQPYLYHYCKFRKYPTDKQWITIYRFKKGNGLATCYLL